MGYVKIISWILVVRIQKSGYCEIMDTSASEPMTNYEPTQSFYEK